MLFMTLTDYIKQDRYFIVIVCILLKVELDIRKLKIRTGHYNFNYN